MNALKSSNLEKAQAKTLLPNELFKLSHLQSLRFSEKELIGEN